MDKKFLLLSGLLIVIFAVDAWIYFLYQNKLQPLTLPQNITEKKAENTDTLPQQDAGEQKTQEAKNADFVPLAAQPLPPFISSLKNAGDVKIDFHYEGEYPEDGWQEPEFYTPDGTGEKFLSLSKLKDREGEYAYGQEYHSIFSSEGSHWYGGTPVYLLDKNSKYSVAYAGFKINNRELVSELKMEFGIDYNANLSIDKSKASPFSSIFGVEPVYACGPGLYLRLVGDSALTFMEESDGIAWYRLEKPIALYDLRLSYCDQDCSSKPAHCTNLADDPAECDNYSCCFYDTSIEALESGNLRMHVLYKPDDKEGFLKFQTVNLILSDPAGAYYQTEMGEDFDHYYRAYLH